jgi:hypothetical protein
MYTERGGYVYNIVLGYGRFLIKYLSYDTNSNQGKRCQHGEKGPFIHHSWLF